jgi:hypothetical protein
VLAAMLQLSKALADIPTLQNRGAPVTIASGGPLSTYDRCAGGQSSAVVQATSTTLPGPTPTPSPTPPATPTPGPTSTPIAWTGVVSIYTAADIGGAPGPTESPYLVTPAPTFSNAPFKAYVKLASDQYVYAVLTTATTGGVNITITCSAAVVYVPTFYDTLMRELGLRS